MKRLNKITLILVAVMGMAISGCGGNDIKKAPYVSIHAKYAGDNIRVSIYPCKNEKIYKTDEAFRKCIDKWGKIKDNGSVINLKGRRDCGKLPVKAKDCPPKDRMDDESYSFTLKTKFGTFKYDTSDKSTKTKNGYYAPIGYKGGNK